MIQIFSLRFASDTILPVTGGQEGTTDYLKTEPQNTGAGLAGVHALRSAPSAVCAELGVKLGEQLHQMITVEAGVLKPLEAHRPAAV